jgi:hypothetical protein
LIGQISFVASHALLGLGQFLFDSTQVHAEYRRFRCGGAVGGGNNITWTYCGARRLSDSRLEAVILPLSGDGVNVDMLMAGLDWK